MPTPYEQAVDAPIVGIKITAPKTTVAWTYQAWLVSLGFTISEPLWGSHMDTLRWVLWPVGLGVCLGTLYMLRRTRRHLVVHGQPDIDIVSEDFEVHRVPDLYRGQDG